MLAYAITNSKTALEFKQTPDIILYRDKSNKNYAKDAQEFLDNFKKLGNKRLFLHGDYVLANKLNADGVHLRSDQLEEIPKAKELNLFVVCSIHNLEEAKLAQKLGADMITFSPIFDTPNKGKPVGIKVLKNIIDNINIPVLALGGVVTKKHIEECQSVGAYGFASIRYFI